MEIILYDKYNFDPEYQKYLYRQKNSCLAGRYMAFVVGDLRIAVAKE